MSVVFFTKDLRFSSRVTSVATRRSIERSVLSNADERVERASTVSVKVILLDLGTSGLDPVHLVPQLRKLTPPPRAIVAFGPHVHEAKLAATRCSHAASSIVGGTRFLPIISANRMDRLKARQG